jgi:hypothetical protein
MNRLLPALPLALALATPAWANIDIVFDYSYDTSGFFGSTQRSLMEAAASAFESRITDNLGAITSSGSNDFNVSFFDPGVSSLAPVTLNDVSIPNDEVLIYVGATNLGNGVLGVGGPGSIGGSGMLTSLSRGQTGYSPTDNNPSNDTDFGPWGGSISFNSTFGSWYFDPNGVDTKESFPGQYDFYSTAVHEIAHVLGFGTADSWKNQVNAGSHTFTGLYSGTQPLANDNVHWKNGLTSTIDGTGSFETAMDPSLSSNVRKYFTDLDYNALRDIGWQVAAVPESDTWVLLAVGLGWVAFATRRARQI